ncbi:thiol-disulfide isomerase [Bordetella sp. H567]|uniref:TlpA family protein disulfide reductase n=1 Tax=Bordetella sp. H567 TaxID=1697043 RepID=UPI00081C7095|nr:thiol-disulfide isomerase [Bordetella sp. H567]AOB32793.1 thiol-disulfide isomerase [Bordetella sp. H567]
MTATEQRAPELRVQRWIGADGEILQTPVKLADLGTGVKVLFAFQDWCRGCHEHGFPTLQSLRVALAPRGVGFAVIQTVFEGELENTFDKLRSNQIKYDLPILFGHDVPEVGQRLPSFMTDYQTGGTPWFTIIDAEGQIVFSDFHLDPDRLLAQLKQT